MKNKDVLLWFLLILYTALSLYKTKNVDFIELGIILGAFYGVYWVDRLLILIFKKLENGEK